jgi:uncharacterized membrane protein
MWTREMIKTRAKGVLRLNYWKAFLVSLVLLFAGAHGSGGGGNNNINQINNRFQFGDGALDIIWMIAAFIASIAIILIILRILLGYMLEVGGRKFFLRAAQGETNMGYLAYCFEKDRYFEVLITMLVRSIYTFLWTLLLIIPGIIKSYAYRMVPYILADNPNIGCNRAIELSSEMTKGEKFEIFILDLSFIGWYLLGALALGIGILFVNPYADATNAELYLILRKNAIDKGLTSYEELNIYKAIE